MSSLYRALTHCSKRTRPHSLPSFSVFYSTKQPREIKEVVVEDIRPRPTEIPFQPKVANSVNFIGVVQSPVQFLVSHDGKYWAGTIITQESPSNLPLSIPVIFEGDLAHTAACHLKENDDIYIAGHLSADKVPLTFTSNQENLQIVARSLNFVQGSLYAKGKFTSHKEEKKPTKSASMQSSKRSPYAEMFVSAKKAVDSSSWEDLFNNPTEWRDFRDDKLNQVVKPKHPDFKHKQNGLPLWLSSAPSWVFKKVDGFEIKGHADVPKKLPGNRDSPASGVESWKDLIENPGKWWDNRSGKPTDRHPDFKHKDSGEALWLDKAPDWALPKLPPL